MPMLAPLVGDAPTVTFIGLCKNAGKTTAMCRLMEELPGEKVLVVSGSTARKALGKDEVAVDAAIVGIIDSVELEREKNGK